MTHLVENWRRVTRRISFTTCLAGSFTDPVFCPTFAPSMATMGQKSSLPQPAPSVSLALMPDTGEHGSSCGRVGVDRTKCATGHERRHLLGDGHRHQNIFAATGKVGPWLVAERQGGERRDECSRSLLMR